VAVEYGDALQVTLDMDALYQELQEGLARLQGWRTQVATRAGWHHLTAALLRTGSTVWTAAIRGQSERLEIRELSLDLTPRPEGLWLLGVADWQGTWSASPGGALAVLHGTTDAGFDGTCGRPGYMAPGPELGRADRMPLRGTARAGTELRGQERLPRIAFEASVALDAERTYEMIAGRFAGEAFTWQEFLEGWDALWHEAVCAVQIRTGTYTLALAPSAQAYQDALSYYAQLGHDVYK
jgi:hypothetical protein